MYMDKEQLEMIYKVCKKTEYNRNHSKGFRYGLNLKI